MHKVPKGYNRMIVKNDKFVYHLDPKKYMIFKFDFELTMDKQNPQNNKCVVHYENKDFPDKMMHIYPSADDTHILIVLEDEKQTVLLQNNQEEYIDPLALEMHKVKKELDKGITDGMKVEIKKQIEEDIIQNECFVGRYTTILTQ